MIQLLDGRSLEDLRTSFRIRFCTRKYLVKVTSFFLHQAHAVVVRAAAIAKGIQLISTCCPSNTDGVLAKLEVLCTLIGESKTDASLRCFLVHRRANAHVVDKYTTLLRLNVTGIHPHIGKHEWSCRALFLHAARLRCQCQHWVDSTLVLQSTLLTRVVTELVLQSTHYRVCF